jgi:hypothetical protein
MFWLRPVVVARGCYRRKLLEKLLDVRGKGRERTKGRSVDRERR